MPHDAPKPRDPRHAVTRPEFDELRALVRARAGLVIDPGKEYFVELRLGWLAVEEGFDRVSDLLASLRTEESWGPLHRRVVESLAITETSFFRDLHPFESLKRDVLPELIARRSKERELAIWSAACASGQEPYSVAMLAREHFPMLGAWNVRILATDFSNAMLRRAREGLYSQLEVNRGLPAHCLVRWFRKDGPDWRVNDDLKRAVEFRELNLIQPWPALPAMDVVLMRNVLLYFDDATRRDVLRQLRRVLKPDGWLFLGGGETPLRLDDAFEAVPFGRTVGYQPKFAEAA